MCDIYAKGHFVPLGLILCHQSLKITDNTDCISSVDVVSQLSTCVQGVYPLKCHIEMHLIWFKAFSHRFEILLYENEAVIFTQDFSSLVSTLSTAGLPINVVGRGHGKSIKSSCSYNFTSCLTNIQFFIELCKKYLIAKLLTIQTWTARVRIPLYHSCVHQTYLHSRRPDHRSWMRRCSWGCHTGTVQEDSAEQL